MRRLALCVAVALLACAPPQPAAAVQQPFTIEQALSAAFPTELVAAPTDGKVAWLLNARGVRNIWVAEPPAYHGRQLTHYTEDDGVDIGQLVWTPDARAVVYTRGGDLETGRDAPNPANAPAVTEQAIWMATLDGKAPRMIDAGSSAAVSPRGDRVAYVSRGEIWWARLDGDEKPEPLVHAKGSFEHLVWSPDGSQLAFVTTRASHGFVGVCTIETKKIRYVDPSVDNDSEPVWSPDGRRIAFLRIPTEGDAAIFAPEREGQPWSIRVADVATGEGREVWRAEPGRGSVFRGIVADRQLFWTAGDRIVFPWERDGWTHLYAVPVSGGAATSLTPGAFEVEHVALTANEADLVYSSNQGDVDRRHLWRVAASGGKPVALTSGTGIEWSPVGTSDGRAVAYLCSDARRPAHAAIRIGSDAARELAPEAIPADFPSTALVEPQPVVVTAADGMKIHAQLFLPGGSERTRHPAVVFFHGGSRRQMLLGWHYMDYYHNAYALNEYLASRGYVVLSVNYRSGIGYGMEFREAINYGAAGASEFNDVVGAGLYLRGRSDVDPDRIGLWGGSYGGYLTALGLARASDMFAAGVDFHGVHDWRTEIVNWLPTWTVEHPDEARRAFESSPMAAIDTWRSPVLLVHGDDDRNVPFVETTQLVAALRKRGVELEQLIIPGEIHDFLRHESWVRSYTAAARFLDNHLQEVPSR